MIAHNIALATAVAAGPILAILGFAPTASGSPLPDSFNNIFTPSHDMFDSPFAQTTPLPPNYAQDLNHQHQPTQNTMMPTPTTRLKRKCTNKRIYARDPDIDLIVYFETTRNKRKCNPTWSTQDDLMSLLVLETKTSAVDGHSTTYVAEPTQTTETIHQELHDEPELPQKPDEPELPLQPDQPDEPEMPEDPKEPQVPMQPTVPENPPQPTKLSQPQDPEEPEKPDVPQQPEDPDEPNMPQQPEDPDEPNMPQQPEQPEVPEEPSQLEDPVVPEEPKLPDEPELPEEPEDSDDPNHPEETETPSEPDEPEEPEIPELPQQPKEQPKEDQGNESKWSLSAFHSHDLSGFWQYKNSFGMHNRAFVRDPDNTPDTVLRVFYPARSYNPSSGKYSGNVGGTGFYAQPMDLSTARTVKMSYKVYFSPAFDFVKGGKLPGLYGGKESCSGGNQAKSCFSTRFMFRSGGEGELYTYIDLDQQVPRFCMRSIRMICNPPYGISIGRGSWTFNPGHWQTLEQTVRLNTIGRPDGSAVVTVDGKVVIDLKNVVWRAKSFGFEGIDFATFFGGSDESWATPSNQYTYFKDFSLTVLEHF